MERLAPLLDWFAAHPHWTGLAVGLVAFLESLAVVGLLVPGAAAMFAFGALIEAGSVSFGVVWAWAVAGAVAGDGISFWLGRRYGDQLRQLWPLSRYPGAFDHGVRFFAAHGGKSVIIGRFVGPVRPIIPAVAGMMGMPRWRFAVANVASALFWAPAYLLPGMVFAASLAVAAAVATRLAIIIVLLLVVAWGVWRLLLLARPLLKRRRAQAEAVLARRPRLRLLRIAVVGLGHHLGRLWWLALAALIIVALAGQLERPLAWERLVMEAMTRLRTEQGQWLAWAVSQMAAPLAVGMAVIAITLGLAIAGYRRLAFGFGLMAASTGIIALGLEWLIAWGPGPENLPVVRGAGLAVVVLGLFVVVWPPGRAGRRLALGVATGLVGAAAIARLYLAGTLPLAVIGGLSLGIVKAGGLSAIREPSPPPRRVAGAGALALMLGAGLAGFHGGHGSLAAYPEPVMAPTLPAEAGCAIARERLGPRHDDRFWRGQASQLAVLSGEGWQPARPWSLRSALRWLDPSPAVQEMPALPAIHNGRWPELVLVRVEGELSRRILYAWSVARVANSNERWWRLAVVREELNPAWPMTLATTRDAALPLAFEHPGEGCSPPPR